MNKQKAFLKNRKQGKIKRNGYPKIRLKKTAVRNIVRSVIPHEIIIRKIFFLRDQKIMIDRDLAELYGVTPRRLREQVKRNLKRFPSHFMFRLSRKEVLSMVSQNAIPSLRHLGGTLPYAFNEHGILQLANVLTNDRAILAGIRIIEVFVQMRELLMSNKDILIKIQEIEKQVLSQDEKVQLLFEYVKQFISENEKPRTKIGFKFGRKSI